MNRICCITHADEWLSRTGTRLRTISNIPRRRCLFQLSCDSLFAFRNSLQSNLSNLFYLLSFTKSRFEIPIDGSQWRRFIEQKWIVLDYRLTKIDSTGMKTMCFCATSGRPVHRWCSPSCASTKLQELLLLTIRRHDDRLGSNWSIDAEASDLNCFPLRACVDLWCQNPSRWNQAQSIWRW